MGFQTNPIRHLIIKGCKKKAVKRKHGKPEVTVVYEKEANNIIA